MAKRDRDPESWMALTRKLLSTTLPTRTESPDKRTAVFRGMYLTGDQSLTSREWIRANIRETGPMGAPYPVRTWTAPNPHACVKVGDTPSWFFWPEPRLSVTAWPMNRLFVMRFSHWDENSDEQNDGSRVMGEGWKNNGKSCLPARIILPPWFCHGRMNQVSSR